MHSTIGTACGTGCAMIMQYGAEEMREGRVESGAKPLISLVSSL